MYVSKSYLVPNIIKRYVFVLVRVYVIRMSIMHISETCEYTYLYHVRVSVSDI